MLEGDLLNANGYKIVETCLFELLSRKLRREPIKSSFAENITVVAAV